MAENKCKAESIKTMLENSDKSTNGYMDIEDINRMFISCDPSFDPSTMVNLYKECDAEGNGKVCIKTFIDVIFREEIKKSPRDNVSSDNIKSATTLRILQVTDVYILDNFPSLRTLIMEKRAELDARRGGDKTGSKTVSMLTGDFLMPYLLSSLDKGRGMMRMMNETPIDYLTWGNHECDLDPNSVIDREREYQGVWINTNMTDHETYKNSKCQTDASFVEIKSEDGSNVRKVGMIGILTNQGYKPGAFRGAKIEDPWETMVKYKAKLEQEDKCDLVIPLCHLYEPQDEYTASILDVPVILSGHDHHIVNKEVNGTRILKAGADAHYCVVLDITWEHGGDCAPKIEAEVIKVADYKPDPVLADVVTNAYSVLDYLRKTQLTVVPEKYKPLSSEGARDRHCSMGTYLCSQFRDALNMDCPVNEPQCDCCIFKAGACPRGMRAYGENDLITLEVLRSEIEAKQEISLFKVPGKVLRGGLRETWSNPNPGWMQYSDDVKVDSDGYVIEICNKPIDPERIYNVASCGDFSRETDSPSIGAWLRDNKDCMPDHDAGIPAHALLMQLWADSVWEEIWKACETDGDGELSNDEIAKLDLNKDGKLDKVELATALNKICGFSTHKDEYSFVEALLVAAGDVDHDGCLTLAEMNTYRKQKSQKRASTLSTLSTSVIGG